MISNTKNNEKKNNDDNNVNTNNNNNNNNNTNNDNNSNRGCETYVLPIAPLSPVTFGVRVVAPKLFYLQRYTSACQIRISSCYRAMCSGGIAFNIRASIMVKVPACRAEDPGSIPGRGVCQRL